MRRSLAIQVPRRPLVGRARRNCTWLLTLAFALAPLPALAQQPDLNILALHWARGRYVSPILCQIDGEPTRGGRRLTIMPGPKHLLPRVDTLLFADLDVPATARCFNDLGVPQPNVLGRLNFRRPGASRPDSALRDFESEMKRSRGFEFHVVEGTLRILMPGEEAHRDVDFSGAKLKLNEIQESSDDARVLGDLTGSRKLVLEITSDDGTHLRFPMVMTQRR